MRRVALLAALGALLATLPPALAKPRKDPDGRYAGRLLKENGKASETKIKMRVTKDGRRIRKLSTTTVAFCIGPTIYDNHIAILTVYIPTIKVRRNGRFKGTSKPSEGTEFKYKGRRVGRRVRGEIDVRVVNCFSDEKFRAKRVGR